MNTEIEAALQKIRPLLAADGGNIELVAADEATGRVTVALRGACSCCPAAQTTLKLVVERKLKEEISWIREVVSV